MFSIIKHWDFLNKKKTGGIAISLTSLWVIIAGGGEGGH
jgi:hypothetical protein